MFKQSLKILFASYEVAPFYKQGGLADVAGSLPKALKLLGVDIRIIMPYYTNIKNNFSQIKLYQDDLQIRLNNQTIKFRLLTGNLPGSKVKMYFIDAPQYFQVKNIFDKKMRERFIVFSELIVKLLRDNDLGWQPQIIHNNDWQTAGIPIKIKLLNLNYHSLLTIHNIGYAGRTKIETLKKFAFQEKNFSRIKNNKVNLLREAILYADKINTVSPTYAQQILSRKYGYDMADALRKRKKDLSGILNGIDEQLFNPAKDKAIKQTYQIKTLHKKIENKLWLQKISGLPLDPERPLLGMVSRLAGQKGFNILEAALPELLKLNGQLVILGTGEKKYELFFSQANKIYKGKFKAHIKFDSQLARQIYAGADMFLMPSLYEPCGLGQLIAMRYGTLPIVRATGGLQDTVKKAELKRTKGKWQVKNIKQATGFIFNKYSPSAMLKAIKEALAVYQHKPTWQQIMKNAMSEDFSWQSSAKEYLRLYQNLVRISLKK